jgi:hypothetical protein
LRDNGMIPFQVKNPFQVTEQISFFSLHSQYLSTS